jgi:ABC-type sugar transport system ATPase subunit
MRDLRGEGISTIFVTHRLSEVLQICDRVTVLRDGGLSETGPMADYDENRLIAAMVGRELAARREAAAPAPRPRRRPRQPLLKPPCSERKPARNRAYRLCTFDHCFTSETGDIRHRKRLFWGPQG